MTSMTVRCEACAGRTHREPLRRWPLEVRAKGGWLDVLIGALVVTTGHFRLDPVVAFKRVQQARGTGDQYARYLVVNRRRMYLGLLGVNLLEGPRRRSLRRLDARMVPLPAEHPWGMTPDTLTARTVVKCLSQSRPLSCR